MSGPYPAPLIEQRGRVAYGEAWTAMRRYTDERDAATPDALWCLEHPAVYTLGLGGKREHILDAGDIPVIGSDRGGQVTYHGPGQAVVYVLADIKRLHIGVRRLVNELEEAVIALLSAHGVSAGRRSGAPGVYVDGAKVAALGLRIRRGCSYHGVALNVDVDLEPFRRINPCGYAGLAVTRTRDLGINLDWAPAALTLAEGIAERLAAAAAARADNVK